MHHAQARLNNPRSAAHAYTFDRESMRGEGPCYEAEAGTDGGGVDPAHPLTTRAWSPAWERR